MKAIKHYFYVVYDVKRLMKYILIHTVSLESDVQVICVHCVCVFSREEIFFHRIPVTQWACWTLHYITVVLFGRGTCKPKIKINEKLQFTSRC